MSTKPVIAPSADATLSRRGFFMKLGILFNGFAAIVLAVPVVRFLLSSVTRGRGNGYLSWVPLGDVSDFPEGETRLATFRNPIRDAHRWQDGRHCLLGAAHRRRSIPGLCHQLRAPGLPGPLVSAIRSVHVPMSRRSLLPRWLARVRATGARALRISVQSRERPDDD